MLRATREHMLEMISGLSDASLARTAVFEGDGLLALRRPIHDLCSHDPQHLAGLRSLLGKADASRLATRPRYRTVGKTVRIVRCSTARTDPGRRRAAALRLRPREIPSEMVARR